MDAFLMHLDEELINNLIPGNNRQGRYYGKKYALLDQQTHTYTPRELAFWINFYSLFYEHIYVPVNFLTDSQWTIEILHCLHYNDKDSLIRSDESPLRVFWDCKKWPYPFKKLVESDWNDDESVTNMISKEEALKVAKCCEVVFKKNRILFGPTDFKVSLTHSLQELRDVIFNEGKNSANLMTPLKALQDCAATLLSNPIPGKGYGRNLLYSMFGYHRNDKPRKQIELHNEFKKTLEPYIDKYDLFRHEFLAGVDRVSHEFKAKKASEILKKDLKILMPPDYYDVFHLPAYDHAVKDLHVAHEDVIFVDPKAIIEMTPLQLKKIRKLAQRKDFMDAWAKLENAGQEVSRDDPQTAGDMLGKYFKAVGHVLHRRELQTSHALKVVQKCSPIIGTGIGAGVPWILQLYVSPGFISFAGSILGCSVGLAIAERTEEIRNKIIPTERFGVSQVGLTKEIRIHVDR